MTSSFEFIDDVEKLSKIGPSFIVHSNGKRFEQIARGSLEFFEKLAQKAKSEGYAPIVLHEFDLTSFATIDSTHPQIAYGPRNFEHSSLLYAEPSYVVGFWYLDAKGYYWRSSLAELQFDPSKIDAEAATYFFNGVSGFMKKMNYSKRHQALRTDDPLPKVPATIFVQRIENYRTKIHYLTMKEILETTSASIDGTIYVKLHPLQTEEERREIIDFCAKFENLQIQEASIHDLIAASEIVISQNSAVGFEAMMHQTPAILCAQSDYHHAALSAKSPTALVDALQNAHEFDNSFPYKKYFYWFLHNHMLEVQKPDFEDRAWSRLMATL